MSNAHPTAQPDRQAHPQGFSTNPVGPPSKHQLALMIWVAVFPTLTVLNLAIGPWLSDSGPVLRTFVLATIAVPIVILRTHAAAAPPPCAHSHPTRCLSQPFIPAPPFARAPPSTRAF